MLIVKHIIETKLAFDRVCKWGLWLWKCSYNSGLESAIQFSRPFNFTLQNQLSATPFCTTPCILVVITLHCLMKPFPSPLPNPFQSRIPVCTSQSLSLASRPTRTDFDKTWFMYVSYDTMKVIETCFKSSFNSKRMLPLYTTTSFTAQRPPWQADGRQFGQAISCIYATKIESNLYITPLLTPSEMIHVHILTLGF